MPAPKRYLGVMTDSQRWDAITLRPDDVIVATPPKSGTTWMQTIVALLLSGDPNVEPDITRKMPWVDMRARDLDELTSSLAAMSGRRSMKSHTPLDGLSPDDNAHYLCVFRHPLDAHVSFRNFARNISLDIFDPWYPPDDRTGQTFQHFLNGTPDGEDCDAMPLAHILQHYKAAKACADRPNVTLFHFADMKRDLAGTFDKLANLLSVTHAPNLMAQLVQAATFANMRQNADRYAPGGGKGLYKSDAEFFHKGTNGNWQGKLSDRELAAYDAMMDANLSPQDRHWLEHGTT